MQTHPKWTARLWSTGVTALAVALMLPMSGCFRGGGMFAAMAGTAIITAAIVSSRPPPPPRVVYVPEPRPGYAWQPGYWTREGDEWVWIDGRWVAESPGYRWVPARWARDPDGDWHLIEGHWAPVRHRRPPPPPY